MGESKTEAISTQKYGWETTLQDEMTLEYSESVPAVGAVLARHPEMWREHGDLIAVATANLIRTAWAKEGDRQSIEIGGKKLREDLGYEFASPLERLSIDEVVICWIRMGEIQDRHTRVQHSANLTFRQSEYEEGLLLSAQKRYTRALESLARVRKLLKGTAFVQINIAQDGGKQVNLFKIPDGRGQKGKRSPNKAISSGTPAAEMPPSLQPEHAVISDEHSSNAKPSVNKDLKSVTAAAHAPPSLQPEPTARIQPEPAPREPAAETAPSTKTNAPQSVQSTVEEFRKRIEAIRREPSLR